MKTVDLPRADAIALDADDNPVVFVEVKAQRPINDLDIQDVVTSLARSRTSIPYVMLVDRQTIQVLQWNGAELSELVSHLSTNDILSFYDPELPNKEVFDFYLTALVEAWLRDVAYHWKSDDPPAIGQLKAIGLAQRLHNGTTVTESSYAA